MTAAYPAGGFFGFYLQTAGTGGATDPATRLHSDGVFVRQTVAAGAVTGRARRLRRGDRHGDGVRGPDLSSRSDRRVRHRPDRAPCPRDGDHDHVWPDDRCREGGARGHALHPRRQLHDLRQLRDQHLRRARPGHGHLAADHPTEVGEAGSPEARREPGATTPPTRSSSTTGRPASCQTQTPDADGHLATPSHRTAATGPIRVGAEASSSTRWSGGAGTYASSSR